MSQAGGARDVGFDELKAGLRDGSITLIDVREPEEIAAGAIPGSVPMPLSRFDPDALPRETRVVFSCATGGRTARLLEYLQDKGLAYDEHFARGFKGWLAAGEPVEPGRG